MTGTGDNPKAAVEGDNTGHTSMDPPTIGQAKAEGEKKTRAGFRHAKGVEGHQKALCRAALEAVLARRDLPRGRL